MIAFGLRMLNAELPQYLGKTEETISKLSCLLQKLNEVIISLTHVEMNNPSIFFVLKTFFCNKLFKFFNFKRCSKSLARTKA